jgi:hypothetical protein
MSRLFRGVGSSSRSVGDLLSLFGGAFLGALAGLCLDRVVLDFALGNACFIEEAQNAVGRLAPCSIQCLMRSAFS